MLVFAKDGMMAVSIDADSINLTIVKDKTEYRINSAGRTTGNICLGAYDNIDSAKESLRRLYDAAATGKSCLDLSRPAESSRPKKKNG